MRLFAALLVLLLTSPALFAQHPVAGIVTDAATGDPLAGATVQVGERGAVTDAAGAFALTAIPAGEHALRVRFVGYDEVRRTITVPLDAPLAIRLSQAVAVGDEVVVTAVPVGGAALARAAATINLEELTRRSTTSLGEALDFSPGVAMRSFGPAPARPVIRGFDGDRILILENGERAGDLSETAADHALSGDPLAAERVEVVRGPASLLYGSGAIGGVVNVLSDDIPAGWRPGASGTAATHAASVNRQGAVFARGRLADDRWALTARLAARGAGDLRTPEGVLDGTFLRNLDGGLGAAFASGDLTGGVFASGLTRTYGLPELGDPDEAVEIRMHRAAAQARLAWTPAEGRQPVTLRVSAAAYGHDEVEIEDGLEELELSFRQQVLSATLTVPHGAAGPFARGAVGASLYLRDLRVGGEEALTPDASGATVAAFAFQEAPLAEWARLQLGLRGELARLAVRPNEHYPAVSDRQGPAAVSAAAGLHLAPAAGLELGLQLAQAYRVPMLEERFASGPHIGAGVYEIGDPSLGLERALGADAFARLASGALRAEVAAFWSHVDDFVVFNPTGAVDDASGLPVYRYEADRARMLGAELLAEALLAPHLRLRATADFVHGTRLGDGTPLPRIPPMRATLGLVRDAASGWVGGTVRAVAAQNRVAPNEEATPGYVWLGLEGGLRLGPDRSHVIALRMDNVLDSAYRDHLSRVEHRGAPMPGRNVALTYRVIW
jgi:iron complex outermembrane recepter protein